MRIRAAYSAVTLAEYFQDEGYKVNLMIDSITRLARAQREIGLAIGEPPTTGGYPPSVFALLPQILERAGKIKQGSITGFYTILLEGEDFDDPVSDNIRGVLDGHIYLSRDLANAGHYPAVDVLGSISRLSMDLLTKKQLVSVRRFKELYASYKKQESLILVGAYQQGSDPLVDEAIVKIHRINQFLQQDIEEKNSFEETMQKLEEILLK